MPNNGAVMKKEFTKKEKRFMFLGDIMFASWETTLIGISAFILYKVFKGKKNTTDGEIEK